MLISVPFELNYKQGSEPRTGADDFGVSFKVTFLFPKWNIIACRNTSSIFSRVVLLACFLFSISTSVNVHADSSNEFKQDTFGRPTEPSILLPGIKDRRTQKDSLFSTSPLGWLHDSTGKAKQNIKDASGLDLGIVFAHVFQGISEALDDEDKEGAATTFDLLGTWNLVNVGEPTAGQLVFHVQSRWDYGTTGPEDLGAQSLASLIGTGDTYTEYSRAFVLRNLYWRQGSPEAGWSYRLGKITPDGILASSSHIDSQTTYLPTGGVTPAAIAFPDSGIGAVGAWYINDRTSLVGIVSDANADRFNEGDIDEGDLFTAAEVHFKVAPQSPKAPWSKLTFWHTDGTKDGTGINAMTGESGWGFFAMHQQELTSDGRIIGILRYGKSYDDAAVFEEQAGAHVLFYEPRFLTQLKNDVIGAAINWVQSPEDGARDEYNVELFYRFPMFPSVDSTLSYQSVINPAFSREVDHASVYSFRLRVAF